MATSEHLFTFVRDIPDFPKPGMVFKDITPAARRSAWRSRATQTMTQMFAPFAGGRDQGRRHRSARVHPRRTDRAGARRRAGPVRKAGKLPWDTHAHSYDLEYGSDALEVHRDALTADDRVLIVDDVLATGGTAAATCELITRFFASTIVGLSFLLELTHLGGRALLEHYGFPVESVLRQS